LLEKAADKLCAGYVEVGTSPLNAHTRSLWLDWNKLEVCALETGFILRLTAGYTQDLAALDDDIAPATTNVGNAPPPGAAPSTGGKYVPPSMRSGTGRSEMGRTGSSREELPTLRVTNISGDTQENDLRELFGVFGRVARVFVGRDRDTGAGKGFAFVSFEDKAVAQRAMEKVNGKGYDNLILSVQWSRESSPGISTIKSNHRL
jgi:translation initiation factor 3 subunit G